ncbi:MAG: polysaccharide biosynthesis protein, partial [Pedobacter sp.]
MFKQINIVPRWIVFVIDIAICCISLVLAYILRNNLVISAIHTPELARNLLILTIINCVVFMVFRTYSGIIRYTSAQDSFRIIFSILATNGLFFMFNLGMITFQGEGYISSIILIINGLISFLMLITYRVIIKYFFLYIKNLNLDKKKVIIYGAGEAGLATKRTFDHDNRINKSIVAFVDDDPRKVGKSIDGVNILNAQNLEKLIAKHEIDELIFASFSIPLERKNDIVDLCLENEVTVLSIPAHEAWTGGKLQTAQIQNINIEDLLNRKSINIDIEGIGKQLSKKRILITGAAGSIGSEIVRQLTQFDIGLIILCDQSETALHDLCLELEGTKRDKNFHGFMGDVRDEARMEHLFKTYKPHYVYHAAAYKHVPLMEDSPSEAIKTNVRGTKIIADLAVKYGVQKFVMISTDKAVNPTNVMGASKRIAEIYVQSLNNSINSKDHIFTNGLSYINELDVKPITKFITTRFGNVLGSNGSVIPRFKQQIEKGGPVTVTHPEITRYFMTIPE